MGACAAVVLCAIPAKGKDKDTRVACNTAYGEYKSAQANEQAGRLRAARDQYQSCSRATCAGLIQKCSAKYAALIADLPSVVPVVTDEAGEPCVDVQVKVDGEVVASRLDGRGIVVEPGVHEFAFLGDTGFSATRKVMIIEGEKNRPIAVTIPLRKAKAAIAQKAEPASTASVEPHASHEDSAPHEVPTAAEATTGSGGRSLVLPLSIWGGGLLAVAAGGILTAWGQQDNALLSRCSPNCSPSSVAHIRTLYTLSDISLGIGVAAIGVATWLVWPWKSREEPPSQASYKFGVNPTRTGAVASFEGAF
jgi:hypothetical protein